MKKLLLMFAATAAFAAFATPAQAQNEVFFPLPSFTFIQLPPTTVSVGQEFTVIFEFPGIDLGVAEEIFCHYLIGLHGIPNPMTSLFDVEWSLGWSSITGSINTGWFKMKIKEKYAPGPALIVWHPMGDDCYTLVN